MLLARQLEDAGSKFIVLECVSLTAAKKITKSIFDQDPTRTVYIYSNATICPKESDLDLIKDKNIYFYITDYDELSKNMDSTINTLEKNNIPYFRKPAGNWVDCSQIRKHNRTPKRQLIKQGINRDFKKVEKTYGRLVVEVMMNEFVEHSTNHRASVEGCGYCEQQEEK